MKNYIEKMPYLTLWILALGLFTSITFLSLSQIIIIIPCFYFLTQKNIRLWNKSTWALLLLWFFMLTSIVFNQDIAHLGYRPMTKTKYILISVLAIMPFMNFIKNKLDEQNGNRVFKVFLFVATVATISGLIGLFTGFNPLKFKYVGMDRNSGLFGMLMTYAHSLTFFITIVWGTILYYGHTKINIKKSYLIVVLIINLIGLYFTYTRGAYMAAIGGMLTLLLLFDVKKFFLGFAILSIVSGTIWVSSPKIRSVFLERKKISDDVRVGYWRAAFEAFKERPVNGIGFLNFEPSSLGLKQKYQINNDGYYGHAHNNFLEILADTGALGFISMVFWLFFWLVESLKSDSYLSKISVGFIVAFIIGGLTQCTFLDGTNLFFISFFYTISQANLLTNKISHES